jgi:histidinol dehydrogenase
VYADQEALRRVAPYVAAIAEAEGLHAHALSVEVRSAMGRPAAAGDGS